MRQVPGATYCSGGLGGLSCGIPRLDFAAPSSRTSTTQQQSSAPCPTVRRQASTPTLHYMHSRAHASRRLQHSFALALPTTFVVWSPLQQHPHQQHTAHGPILLKYLAFRISLCPKPVSLSSHLFSAHPSSALCYLTI